MNGNRLVTLSNGYIATTPNTQVYFINPNDSTIAFAYQQAAWPSCCSILNNAWLTTLPNGNVAAGSFGSAVGILNSNTGTLLFNLTGHTDYVASIAALGTSYIATGANDNSIKIWNASNGALLQTLYGHTGTVTSVVALPNGWLASASSVDLTIKIWNLVNCSVIYTFTSNASLPNLVLLPNGLLASGPDSGYVSFWNYTNGTRSYLYSSAYTGSLLTVLPTGNVAAGSFNNKADVINANSGTKLFSLASHTHINVISSLSPSLIATGGYDSSIRIWTAAGTLLQTLKGHSNSITSIVPLANGFMSSDKSYVKIWKFTPQSMQSKALTFIFILITKI